MSYRSRLDHEEITDLDLSARTTESAPPTHEPAANVVPLPAKTQSMKVSTFDYTGVTPAVAKEAELVATRIRDRLRASKIDIGKDLLTIKEKLAHGSFGDWIRFHFGWSERSAQNMMNSAMAFGSTPQIADKLPEATIYKLAAKSTPEEVRQAVIEEINRGGSPDPKEVAERIAQSKSANRSKSNDDAGEPKVDLASMTQPIKGADAEARDVEVTPVAITAGDREKLEADAQSAEVRAKKITEFLKAKFGDQFEKFRDLFLKTDFAALRKALKEG